MKSLFNKYIWLQLILSILLLFGGAVIIAFAINDIKEGTTHVPDALNISVAVILFLFGAFAILATILFEIKNYITAGVLYGSASIALGIMFCAKKLFIIDFLVYLLAIFLIVVGAIELVKTIIMTVKHKEYETWRIVVGYIVAVIFIAGGIVSLIPSFNDALKIPFCIVAGALLILAGGYQLFSGIKALIAHAKGEDNTPATRVENNKKKGKNKNESKVEEAIDAIPVAEEAPREEPEIKELDYTSNLIEEKKTDE